MCNKLQIHRTFSCACSQSRRDPGLKSSPVCIMSSIATCTCTIQFIILYTHSLSLCHKPTCTSCNTCNCTVLARVLSIIKIPEILLGSGAFV